MSTLTRRRFRLPDRVMPLLAVPLLATVFVLFDGAIIWLIAGAAVFTAPVVALRAGEGRRTVVRRWLLAVAFLITALIIYLT